MKIGFLLIMTILKVTLFLGGFVFIAYKTFKIASGKSNESYFEAFKIFLYVLGAFILLSVFEFIIISS